MKRFLGRLGLAVMLPGSVVFFVLWCSWLAPRVNGFIHEMALQHGQDNFGAEVTAAFGTGGILLTTFISAVIIAGGLVELVKGDD